MKTILLLLFAIPAISAVAQEKDNIFVNNNLIAYNPPDDYIQPLPTYEPGDSSGKKPYSVIRSYMGDAVAIGMIDGPMPMTDAPKKITLDFNYPTRYVFTASQINQMPVWNINDLLSVLPGSYQVRRGDNVSVYGSRQDGNLYIIDGTIINH